MFKLIFKIFKYFFILYLAIGLIQIAQKQDVIRLGSELSCRESSAGKLIVYGFPAGHPSYGDTLVVNLK